MTTLQNMLASDAIATCACEKTVVMLKHPGHFTSMKNELGAWTRRLSLCLRFSSDALGWRRSFTCGSHEKKAREMSRPKGAQRAYAAAQ